MTATPSVDVASHLSIEDVRHRLTITVPEAAQLVGVGRNSCYEAIHRGELPSLRIGARLVVPVAPLLRLLGVQEG